MKSIRAKLALAFFAVNLLAVIIAITGFYATNQVAGTINIFNQRSIEMKDVTELIGLLERMENAKIDLVKNNSYDAVAYFAENAGQAKKIQNSLPRSGKSKLEQILIYLLNKELIKYEKIFNEEIVPEWQAFQQSQTKLTAQALTNITSVESSQQSLNYLYQANINTLLTESELIKNKINTIIKNLQEQFNRNNDAVTARLFNDISLAKTLILVTALGSLLIGSILAITYSRSFTSPINRLVKVTAEAAEGNLNVRPKIKRSDEFGTLARSFTDMLERISRLVGEVKQSALLVEETRKAVVTNADEVLAASRDIAATIEEISKGNEYTTEELTDITSRLSNIRDDIMGATGEINQIEERTIQLDDIARTGLTRIDSTKKQIIQVREIFQQAVKTMSALQEKNEEITNIVNMIREVGEQTNLLALNASIEAARAGEHGRGFAVVAEEIRQLADQSEKATGEVADIINTVKDSINDISSLLESSSNEVEQGAGQVVEVAQGFDEIVSAVDELNINIKTAVNRQQNIKVTSEEVFNQVSNIVAVVEESTAGSEEISANALEQVNLAENTVSSSKSLGSKFEILSQIVNTFKIGRGDIDEKA